MWSVEPRQGLLILAYFVVVVSNYRLGVEQGQQLTRLPVGEGTSAWLLPSTS